MAYSILNTETQMMAAVVTPTMVQAMAQDQTGGCCKSTGWSTNEVGLELGVMLGGSVDLRTVPAWGWCPLSRMVVM